jgi:hypothetical protein
MSSDGSVGIKKGSSIVFLTLEDIPLKRYRYCFSSSELIVKPFCDFADFAINHLQLHAWISK